MTTTPKQYYRKSTWPNATQHLHQAQQQTNLHVQTQNLLQRTNRRVVGKLQWLSFQGIGQRTTSTDWTRLEEGKTSTQIFTSNKQLHTATPTDNNTLYKQSSPRHGRTRGRRLGRMPVYTQEHNRFRNLYPGTPVSFGSRTQATIALSSAGSQLYAICAGTSEGWLHLKMFLQESGLASKSEHSHTHRLASQPDRVHQRKQSTSTYDFSTRSSWQKTELSASAKSTLHATPQTF